MAVFTAFLLLLATIAGGSGGLLTEQALLARANSSSAEVYVDEAHAPQLERIAGEVDAVPHVHVMSTTTKAQALERAKAEFQDAPGVIANLPGNPFPAQIEIEVAPAHRDAAFAAIRRIEGVDDVGIQGPDPVDVTIH